MHDSKPLQSREIQAIRQRHEQATAGPWQICERKIDTFLTDRCVVTTWTDPRSKWQVPIVYNALKHYYDNGSYGQEEGAILEEAMDTCWQLLRARDDF
ncbi:hypothetical protein [Alicyclobacillus macrosporangiidus]|uniref:hypothetical protein n=1 Tax=Alicyclobacillus macrosporangiidus TaxID=392015 RepID=UPI0004967DA1|nr:hypothetical protein [Alicyclobacillus macrosporangiidus]